MELLDLVECGKRYRTRVGTTRFSMPIVYLCKNVLSITYDTNEQEIVFKCIVSLIKSIEYRVPGFIFPSLALYRVDHIGRSGEQINYLARSVIATSKLYDQYLFGRHESQKYNLIEFAQGIEWCCDAIRRYYPIFKDEELPRISNHV